MSPVMVDIVHEFNDEMQACVRLDGERVSEWFEAVLITAGKRLRAEPQEADPVSIRSTPLAVRDGDETLRTSTI